MSNLPVVAKMAERFDMSPAEFEQTVRNTVCKGNIKNEEFVAFLMVAKEYNLNPITKQIYAFPANGAIVPIVSIDGWLRIINDHPQFDGMEFTDTLGEDKKLVSVTCRMYRKDRARPVEVTEYMGECVRATDVWKKWPARMLRHKATIQCARYAFGLSGIYDEDEAARMGALPPEEPPATKERDMGKADVVREEKTPYPQEKLQENLSKWSEYIVAGRKTGRDIIDTLETKYTLTNEQIFAIDEIERLAIEKRGGKA